MKTSLALLVAAFVFCFTPAADAQRQVVYYAPAATTTYYYAPATTYYAPSASYYAAPAYYAPTTAYYGDNSYYGRGYYRGGAFGTGLGGWAGVRGIDRRWDRRGW
jgi:hypothetical protein